MCFAPQTLPNGTLAACRHCKQCKGQRIDDLVGRSLAERDTATLALGVTLTYAGDGPNTQVLLIRDFQLMMKRLRKKCALENKRLGKLGGVRYIVAGEYGSEKGRAHWHAVLFFYGWAPAIVPRSRANSRDSWDIILAVGKDDALARIDWAPWSGPIDGAPGLSHGFSYFQKPDVPGYRYVLKYALKGQSEGASRALSMSKKPPLGHAFFMRMADDLASARLPMHSARYSFADARDKGGKPWDFMLRGRMLQLFIEAYRARFVELWASEPPVTEFWDRKVIQPEALEALEAAKFDPDPDDCVFLGVPDDFLDRAGYLVMTYGPYHGMMHYAAGVLSVDWRGQQWTLAAGGGVSVPQQLQRIGLPLSIERQCLLWFDRIAFG